MKIIDLDKSETSIEETGVALGNFDGVHLAHQELIKKMVETSNKLKVTPSLLMFKNHTRSILNEEKPSMITNNEQKLELFKKLGVEIIFQMTFSEDIMKLSEEEFVKNILIEKLNSKLVVAGFDYRFGYKARGNSDDLVKITKEFDITSEIVNPVLKNSTPISSTKIRNNILEKDFKSVKELLGRNYSIIGEVVDGEKRGRKLGYPTANLKIDSSYILPPEGVYYTKTKVDNKTYDSLTNIGYNPTFNAKSLKIETYILDFKKNIYGKNIEVFFIEYLRGDIKFKKVEDLISQLNKDVKKVEKLRTL